MTAQRDCRAPTVSPARWLGIAYCAHPRSIIPLRQRRALVRTPLSARWRADREPEESRAGTRSACARSLAGGSASVRRSRRSSNSTAKNIAIPDDNGFTQQSGDQRSRGVEIELGGELGNGLSGTFSYAFTEAELTRFAELVFLPGPPFFLSLDRSGNTPAFAPENLFNAWLGRSFPSGLHVGAGLRWVDSQFIAEDNATEIDAYALLDATLSYGKGSWRFSLNLQNLADEDYETRGFGSFSVIPGEPISADVRIEYRM